MPELGAVGSIPSEKRTPYLGRAVTAEKSGSRPGGGVVGVTSSLGWRGSRPGSSLPQSRRGEGELRDGELPGRLLPSWQHRPALVLEFSESRGRAEQEKLFLSFHH